MAIEPLAVASDGYLCASGITLSIATNGYLCKVTVSPPVEPPQPPPTGVPDFIGFGGGLSFFFSPRKMWKDIDPTGDTKVKLITVKIIKDGKEYIEKKYTNDLTLEAKDVKFDVIEENRDIKIKIRFNK